LFWKYVAELKGSWRRDCPYGGRREARVKTVIDCPKLTWIQKGTGAPVVTQGDEMQGTSNEAITDS
jgi:hypothetical protein